MVDNKLVNSILKRLEKYLIKTNNFQLAGDNYDLILLLPSDKYLSDAKYSLLVSSKKLNNFHQKELIKELLNDFKDVLNFQEYNSISRLNLINSEDPFVKNLKFVFAFREKLIEINDITVGGVRIEFAYIIKSLVLDKLVQNKAVTFELKPINEKINLVNAGIIRIEKNFDIVYYTGKGLREIWKSGMTTEQMEHASKLKQKNEGFLLEHNYIAKTSLDDIEKIK